MSNVYPKFTGFDWDDGNREKNPKHDVQSWECEQLFFNEPLIILEDSKHSVSEGRSAAFGRTDSGRPLVIIYTMRGSKIRVVSARDMSRRERQYYEDTGKE
jgi:uncharacterized DUF497 family protein